MTRPDAAEFQRRARAIGVELRTGRHEMLDDLEPLWLSLLDHHVSVGAAGFPVVDRQLSWPRRRRLYNDILQAPDSFVITAWRGDQPVGYCLARVHHGADDTWPTGDQIGEIESLAVLPTERGGGVGTLLLDAAESRLAQHGANDIMLGVLAGNQSAISFYERRGMAPAMIKMLRLGDGPAGRPRTR